jgi:hypothetical protein
MTVALKTLQDRYREKYLSKSLSLTYASNFRELV